MKPLKASILIKNSCEKQALSADYTEAIFRYCSQLERQDLPIIFSLKHLSKITEIDYFFLRQVIGRVAKPYRNFKIAKKKRGEYRIISAPFPGLLRLQKWINSEILSKLEVHHSATAYSKGASIYLNALPHCKSKWLIKMDLESFFHSVNEHEVFKVIHSLGYTSILSFEIARLLTMVPRFYDLPEVSTKYKFYNGLYGFLPQGAPTSPVVSNIIFKQIDQKIYDYCESVGLAYTRYADDISISSKKDFSRDKCVKVIRDIRQILYDHGFYLNNSKTKIIPPGAKKIVTGLTVNDETPRVQREVKDYIESNLKFIRTNGAISHARFHKYKLTSSLRSHLKGMILFVQSIEKEKASKYLTEFGEIDWTK